MPHYQHTQKHHLIICSKAEEHQVCNHSCHYAEWLCVCLLFVVFARAWSENGNPVTAFAHRSQYIVNIFIRRVSKSRVCLVEAEVTGWWLPPTEFWYGFYVKTDFTLGDTRALRFPLNTRLASLRCRHTWITMSYGPAFKQNGPMGQAIPAANVEDMCCRFA